MNSKCRALKIYRALGNKDVITRFSTALVSNPPRGVKRIHSLFIKWRKLLISVLQLFLNKCQRCVAVILIQIRIQIAFWILQQNWTVYFNMDLNLSVLCFVKVSCIWGKHIRNWWHLRKNRVNNIWDEILWWFNTNTFVDQ